MKRFYVWERFGIELWHVALAVCLLVNAYVICDLREDAKEYEQNKRERKGYYESFSNLMTGEMQIPVIKVQQMMPWYVRENCGHLFGQSPQLNPQTLPMNSSQFDSGSMRDTGSTYWITPYERCVQETATTTRHGRCDMGVSRCDWDARALGVFGTASLFTAITSGGWSSFITGSAIGGGSSLYAYQRLRECYTTHCQEDPRR